MSESKAASEGASPAPLSESGSLPQTRVADAATATDQTRAADAATATEMLTNAGFRACVSERRQNHFQAHNSEEANQQAKARVAALARCLIE